MEKMNFTTILLHFGLYCSNSLSYDNLLSTNKWYRNKIKYTIRKEKI